MKRVLAIFLVILVAIALEVLYHKIFHVVYFGGGAIVKEFVACLGISLVIVAVLFRPFQQKAEKPPVNSPIVTARASAQSPENQPFPKDDPAVTNVTVESPEVTPPPEATPLDVEAFSTEPFYFVSSSMETIPGGSDLVAGRIQFSVGGYDAVAKRTELTAEISRIWWKKEILALSEDSVSGTVVSLHEYNYQEYGGRYQEAQHPENDDKIVIKIADDYRWYARYYEDQGIECVELYADNDASNGGAVFSSVGQEITLEELRQRLSDRDETLSEILDLYVTDWDGFYTYEGNENDGTKTMSIQRLNASTLQFEIIHTYGDGHIESVGPVNARIKSWGRDDFRADYWDENVNLTFFSMWSDEDNNRIVSVIQHSFAKTEDDTGFEGVFLLQGEP